MVDMDAVGHLVLLNVLLILDFELIVGDLRVLANLVYIGQGVTDDALLRRTRKTGMEVVTIKDGAGIPE